MVYVFIDTMAFLAMPAGQMAQTRKDFIGWVDTYLKADPTERYQYRGLEFSAEADAHRKDPSVCLFGYIDNGTLVRNITLDYGSDWGMRMMKFVADLGKVQAAITKAERP